MVGSSSQYCLDAVLGGYVTNVDGMSLCGYWGMCLPVINFWSLFFCAKNSTCFKGSIAAYCCKYIRKM